MKITRWFVLVLLALASPALATDPQYGAIRIEATQNVTHSFVSAATQSANPAVVSKNEWNAAHVTPSILIASVPAGLVWPAQPAAVTEFCGGSTSYRWRANLTYASAIRLTAQVISAGAASSALRLQYTTDLTGATGWDYMDGATGPSVSTAASGVAVSSSVSLATAAKADVLLRLVGINGDGGGGTCYSGIKASTATLADTAAALAANPTNCSAGQAPVGVDASGAVESCTAYVTTASLGASVATALGTPSSANLRAAITDETGVGSAVFADTPTLVTPVLGAATGTSVNLSGGATVGAGVNYCADAGANDTYACSISPAPTAYSTGTVYTFKANTANTGAATLNLNALGAKTIVKTAGGITTTLADNDIRAGSVVQVAYDGTNLQLVSPMANESGGGITNASTTYSGGTTNGMLYTNGATVNSSSVLKYDATHSVVWSIGRLDFGGGASAGFGIGYNNYALSFYGNGGAAFGETAANGGAFLSSNTVNTPAYQFTIGAGNTTNAVEVTEVSDLRANYDYNNGRCGTSRCTNPTFRVRSPNRVTTEYLELSNDATLAHIDAQAGTNGVGQIALGGAKTLTESAATVVVDIPVASGAYTGAAINWTVVASDATDHQSRSGSTYLAAVNKAGTETCSVGDVGTTVVAVSTGTLAVTTGQDTTGTSVCTFTINAVSSLAQTVLRAYYTVVITGPGVPAAR